MTDYMLGIDHAVLKHAAIPPVKHAARYRRQNLGMSLGERIKARREQLGKSVAEVAQACGVEPSAVYQWESGQVVHIKPANLLLLRDVLRTSIRWLVLAQGPVERPLSRDTLTADEDNLVWSFRLLTPRQQRAVTSLIDELSKNDPDTGTGLHRVK